MTDVEIAMFADGSSVNLIAPASSSAHVLPAGHSSVRLLADAPPGQHLVGLRAATR